MIRGTVSVALFAATLGIVAGSQAPGGAALSGYVLTQEWLPVSGGTVSVQSPGTERIATIGSNGRFRIETIAPGVYDVNVSAPSLMSHRLKVAIPSSGILTLPPLRLLPPAFVRLRLLSPAGEPVTWPRVLRQSFSVNGSRIPDSPAEWGPGGVDADGATRIGPLPRGIAVLAADTPPFARKRLPDVRITGESPLVDAGTVTLEPGAVLNVQVLDGAGAPVPGHDVFLDDGVAFSPVWFPPGRTDALGRVTFERLASGRYTLRARAIRPCSRAWPTVGHSVEIPRGGTIEKTLVIDGVLRLRLTTSGAPLAGTSVSVTSESAAPAVPPWLREPSLRFLFHDRTRGLSDMSPCTGTTDGSGRVTLQAISPGPARAAVRLANSTSIRRLVVPADGREVNVQIPSGILPARVTAADTQAPVSGASITWTSGGTTVEATGSATGEVVLEGVATLPGRLAVRAPNYRAKVVRFVAPPDVQQEVVLEREGGLELRCRVVTEVGKPVAGAVVERAPHDRLDVGQVAATDSDGFVRFPSLAPGPMRLSTWAGGFATGIVESISVTPQHDSRTVTLSRGYRVQAILGEDAGVGPHAIRIVQETGVPMDEMLDAASERSVERAGRLSLGPLPPGTYLIELRSARQRRSERVRIEDRDVQVTFR